MHSARGSENRLLALAERPYVLQAGLYTTQLKPLIGSLERACSGVLTSPMFSLLTRANPLPWQGPHLCTWVKAKPSGVFAQQGHIKYLDMCRMLSAIDLRDYISSTCYMQSCFCPSLSRKARPGACGQPGVQTRKLVKGQALRAGTGHQGPTYRPVQHRGDEVIADPFHLVGCHLRPVQLLRLREDGAFGIHPNDLQRGQH